MRQMQTKTTQQQSAQTEQRGVQAQPGSAGQRMSAAHGTAGVLLSLQRSHGNRFVQRMLAATVLQRACSCGTCSDCAKDAGAEESDHPSLPLMSPALPGLVQAKLTVSEPGDPYEQEADRVAEEVMRIPEPVIAAPEKAFAPTQTPAIQRIHRSGVEQIQRKEVIERDDRSTPSVSPDFESRLDLLRGTGQPLSAASRAFMEPRFGGHPADANNFMALNSSALRCSRFMNQSYRAFSQLCDSRP
jgi:hypothetical protein